MGQRLNERRRTSSCGAKSKAATSAIAEVAIVGLLAAVGLAACGGSSGGSTTTATRQAAASSSSAGSGATASTPATTTASKQATAGQLPDYHPSSIVSKSSGVIVLTSPSTVTTVGAFYKDALAKGGWQVTSSSANAYHAGFTARRAGEGASITVYPNGNGSGTTISTHPQ